MKWSAYLFQVGSGSNPEESAICNLYILHVVDDPGGSPVNKKVSVFNKFGNLNHTTNTGDTTGRSLVKSTLTVANTSTANTMPLEIEAVHNQTTSHHIGNIFGLDCPG